MLGSFKCFRFADTQSIAKSIWRDVFTTPAEVTSGHSVFNPRTGYKINLDQTIATFLSRVFPSPLEATILNCRASSGQDSTSSSKLIVKRASAEAQISLERTIRIPDDRQDYTIPASFGDFPLYDVKSFSGKLPISMVAQGGLFMPMYGMCDLKISSFIPKDV